MIRPHFFSKPTQSPRNGPSPWGDMSYIGRFMRKANMAVWLGDRLKVRWEQVSWRVPAVNNRAVVYA